MTYEEARTWLAQVSRKGSRLGLDSIRTLLAQLGNPQDQLTFVHIAGTNGKGSVMTFLEQTLIEAGYRTGRYVSPAVFCYEEIIRVNGQYIPKEEIAYLAGVIRDAMEQIRKRGEELPTVFEVETAMAFLHFLRQKCDIVLLETGMGGLEDATNIIRTGIVELFSSISMDHMQYLGDTPAKIAAVKAGILKPGTIAASDEQTDEVKKVLEEAAAKIQAPICFADPASLELKQETLEEQIFTYTCSGPMHTRYEDMIIHLAGPYQLRNAALALEAVDLLRVSGYEIQPECARKGFVAARWPGRFEVIHRDPLVIADGAHNPDGALQLRKAMERYFPGRRIYCIFGVFYDKEYDRIIDIMADLAFRFYTVQAADNPRAMDAGELARIVSCKHPDVVCMGDVKKALQEAMQAAGKQDVILLFGSLAWLHEAREVLGKSNYKA